jgi:hypothetical protein
MGEACSVSPNVDMRMVLLVDMRIMDDTDYFVVMAGYYSIIA